MQCFPAGGKDAGMRIRVEKFCDNSAAAYQLFKVIQHKKDGTIGKEVA